MSALLATPTPPAASRHPAGSPAPAGKPDGSRQGAWRYERHDHPWLVWFLGLFVSASIHGVLLYGFNGPKKVEKVAVVDDTPLVQIVMPEIQEEPTDTVEELVDVADEAPAVSVPMLADSPSVTVSAFVQPLQYVPDVSASLQATKVSQIPVNIARGGRNLSNLGQIFEISQLDRVPTPIAQPGMTFPFHLKQQYSRATVLVEFIVTENGEVVNITASQGVHRDFEEAAIQGVSKWRFRPGMRAGKRVNTRVRVPVNFVIEDE